MQTQTSTDTTAFSILLVDADPAEAGLVNRILLYQDRPYRVAPQSSTSSALRHLSDAAYDLALLDHRTIGLDVGDKVRRFRGSNVDEIAITSNCLLPAQLCCPEATGADHVVDKLNLVKFLHAKLRGNVAGTHSKPCKANGRL